MAKRNARPGASPVGVVLPGGQGEQLDEVEPAEGELVGLVLALAEAALIVPVGGLRLVLVELSGKRGEVVSAREPAAVAVDGDGQRLKCVPATVAGRVAPSAENERRTEWRSSRPTTTLPAAPRGPSLSGPRARARRVRGRFAATLL